MAPKLPKSLQEKLRCGAADFEIKNYAEKTRLQGEEYRRDDVRLVLVQNGDDDEFVESGKVACTHCLQLLAKSDGNHIKRHVDDRCKKRKSVAVGIVGAKTEASSEPSPKMRKITDYSDKRYKDAEVVKLCKAMSKYCLRSGKSFNHMASESMREYTKDVCNAISCGYGEVAKKQLPSRQTVQKYSEILAKDVIEKAYSRLRPFVGKRVSLLVDHGKHVVNYLSVYASFIDSNFNLQIVPLAFIPALDKKSGRETALLISQRMIAYGWSQEDVESCTVTADGALGTLTTYFNSYVRCVSHSINLVAQRAIQPLESHKLGLSEFKELLESATEILNHAKVVSSAIRCNSNFCQLLSKLPSLPVETRWLSSLKCLRDVVELREEIQNNLGMLSLKAKEAMNKLCDQYSRDATSILSILSPLLQYNDLYQSQKAITLHLVLPSYKRLEGKWSTYANGDMTDFDLESNSVEMLQAIATSGLSAIRHYYEEFTDVHFAAVLLSPRTKKMRNFTQSEKERAHRYVTKLLPKQPSPPKEVKRSVKDSGIATLLSLVSDEQDEERSVNDEFERYLNEHVDNSFDESLEEYWKRKESDFPSLFEVAAAIFSTVPSEAVCETCFSTAGFLLDKRRTRLQYARAELVVIGSQLVSKFPELLE